MNERSHSSCELAFTIRDLAWHKCVEHERPVRGTATAVPPSMPGTINPASFPAQVVSAGRTMYRTGKIAISVRSDAWEAEYQSTGGARVWATEAGRVTAVCS